MKNATYIAKKNNYLPKIARKLMLTGFVLSSAVIASNTAMAASNSGKALYKQECGSCHLAYPANLLPTKSWNKIMSGLDNHFGDSADLPADEVSTIKTYLNQSGYKSGFMSGVFGRYSSNDAPERITTSAFFLGKHDEINAQSVKNNPKVKSFSRCDACHTTAKSGNFDEDNVRIPGGYGEHE